MTYRPGAALRHVGWISPHRFTSFTREIDPIRDHVAIFGTERTADRLGLGRRELSRLLTVGEAPTFYVGAAILALQRRVTGQKRTFVSEYDRPENAQL